MFIKALTIVKYKSYLHNYIWLIIFFSVNVGNSKIKETMKNKQTVSLIYCRCCIIILRTNYYWISGFYNSNIYLFITIYDNK